LLVAAPAIAVVAACVKVTSPGPVLFRQVRLGRDGQPFTIIKFRTMAVDAEARRPSIAPLNEARGAIFKIRNDPRQTRFGGVLRQTSLDELPQLVNVLRGDMSLVGPRPLPPWVADDMPATLLPNRTRVLPGLTGLWQVRGRVQDSETMLRDDLEYVQRWSMWLDLAILARTPVAVLRGGGKYGRP
jgi:lipopolysaccharide/colanic/teichoic acid biosynthesis glycosyltransferase